MLALQIVACGITLLAVWLTGNKHISGPALNALAALCFAALNACAAFSAAMAAVNFRNFIRWRRDARAVVMIVAVAALFLSAPPAFARHHHVVAPAPAPSFFSIFQVQPQEVPNAHAVRKHVRHAAAVRSTHARAPAVASSFIGNIGGGAIVEAARHELGNGAIYGRRNLWCARFMNAVLQRVGYHGTGSDMASSFAGMPHTTMHVGAIAVMSRRGGGHVGVVSGFDARGNPILISGNNGGRVRESVYPLRRIYSFVEAR